jgi:hypothetical protein
MRSRSRRSAPKRSRGTVGGMDVEAMPDRGWSRAFDEPIPLPDGGELRTQLDAGHYVDKLPRSMQEREVWQAVMEVLLSAVEGREPVRLVQVALTLALQESKPMKGARRKPVKK